MKNIITEELGHMKYLLGYQRGVVISEQRTKTGCINGDCTNGQGTHKYTDGSVYVGTWKDGKRNGEGTYKWVDGVEYKGTWKDGKFNGQGTYTYKNGDVYVGQWKDNNKNGQGTRKYSDGSKYVGEWKDDKLNGQGTYTNLNGVESSGIWVDDKLNGKSLDELDKITQSNTECAQPTEPTHRYKDDKNYRYAKSGDCWWAKNINNNKWFNLTELVKTKPDIQISIDRLNDGTNLIKL